MWKRLTGGMSAILQELNKATELWKTVCLVAYWKILSHNLSAIGLKSDIKTCYNVIVVWYVVAQNTCSLIWWTFCSGNTTFQIIFHFHIFLPGPAWSLEGDKVKHVVAVDSLLVKFRCVSECLTGLSNPSRDKEPPKWYLMKYVACLQGDLLDAIRVTERYRSKVSVQFLLVF